MAALDLATTAKALRIIAQALHEVHGTLLDAATDLELLAPDEDEEGDDGWIGEAAMPKCQPIPMDEPCCGEEYQDRVCTRPPGHSGRHLAYSTGTRVIAAWPGRHAPIVADLYDEGGDHGAP